MSLYQMTLEILGPDLSEQNERLRRIFPTALTDLGIRPRFNEPTLRFENTYNSSCYHPIRNEVYITGPNGMSQLGVDRISRFYPGAFDNCDVEVFVLIHELVHCKQHFEGRLIAPKISPKKNTLYRIFEGKEYYFDKLKADANDEYICLPWEAEANNTARELANSYGRISVG